MKLVLTTRRSAHMLLGLAYGILVRHFFLFTLFLALSGWAIFVSVLLGIIRQASRNVSEPPRVVVFWKDRLTVDRLERGLRLPCLGRDIASVDPIQKPLKNHMCFGLRVQALGQCAKPKGNSTFV